MLSFHNDASIKQKYIDRVKLHFEADEIIKGVYWENGKGCAIGCTLYSGSHINYEIELGIPEILAYLEDIIFESLPNDLAKTWPLQFLAAINVGVDLSLIWPKFAYWLLVDPEHGVIKFNRHQSIIDVATLFQRIIEGEKLNITEWQSTTDAATNAASAYAYAAYATNSSKASASAYAAASANAISTSAYAISTSANAASDYAYAYAAARKKHFVLMSEKLLELLKEAE